jgi:hypothetical protein
VGAAIDGNLTTGWAVAPQFGRAHTAFFELKSPLANAGRTVLTFTMLQQFAGGEHNIGRFRLAVTNAPVPLQSNELPSPIVGLLRTDRAKRSPNQQAELVHFYRQLEPEWVRRSHSLAAAPLMVDRRQSGAQDIVWALINSKAFQFNH